MPVPWKKRKARVKLWEQRNKAEGRLPYWNDRARYLNYIAKKRYYCTGTVTGQELMDLYDSSNKTCIYCKTSLTPGQIHFDHMDPLINGGENTINNIGIACGECNMSKGDDSIDDFLQRVHDTGVPERIYNNLFSKGVAWTNEIKQLVPTN